MQNHGADTCTNQYIPDFGNFIYRGKKGGDTDQVLGYYRRFKVADLGVSKFGYAASSSYQNYPKPGYQNAPKFCEDTDKSLGTYSFNVPKNLEEGEICVFQMIKGVPVIGFSKKTPFFKKVFESDWKNQIICYYWLLSNYWFKILFLRSLLKLESLTT